VGVGSGCGNHCDSGGNHYLEEAEELLKDDLIGYKT
jgi:hypothetical protein